MKLEQDNFRKKYKIAVSVNAFILGSLFIYAICVEILKVQFKPFTGFIHIHSITVIRYLFYCLAILLVIMIRFFRGIILRKTPSQDRTELIGRLYKTSILTSTLLEGPALFGLALFIINGLVWDFYCLLFVSFLLLFMYFPRYKNWSQWSEGYSINNCSSSVGL